MHASDLDPAELRELHAAELMLACAGVRHARPFDADALHELRAANDRLRRADGHPSAAVHAADEFERRLTARCRHTRVLGVLDTLRGELAPYRLVHFARPGRPARCAEHHERIIAALARGDHAAAEHRLRAGRAAAFCELERQIAGGDLAPS